MADIRIDQRDLLLPFDGQLLFLVSLKLVHLTHYLQAWYFLIRTKKNRNFDGS